MAILSIPEQNIRIENPSEIRAFMNERGIFFDQWECAAQLYDHSTQEEILKAYEKDLVPFMEQGGYLTADVININSSTENYEAIRAKFLAAAGKSVPESRLPVCPA